MKRGVRIGNAVLVMPQSSSAPASSVVGAQMVRTS